jgi:hypothetical protein
MKFYMDLTETNYEFINECNNRVCRLVTAV